MIQFNSIQKHLFKHDMKIAANCWCGRVYDDGPLPEIQTINHVEIPESDIVLEDEDMAALALLVDPLHEDNEYGKQLYVNACEILEMILNE